MAELLTEFEIALVDDHGVAYHVHACGAEMPDGKWQGWIEFLPLDGAPPIRSGRETTQPNRTDAIYWATGLTTVYLEGALRRARSPRIVHRGSVDAPAFDGPAEEAAAVVRTARREAVLDPFSVYEKGEVVLRHQLAALSAWHLINIIRVFELSRRSDAALNQLPAGELIDLIVSRVGSARTAARHRPASIGKPDGRA